MIRQEPLRVAVIGAGHLGRIHARLIEQVDNAKLVGIAEPSPHAQRSMIETYSCEIVSDYHKLLGKIDAAIIATPTRSHFEIAQQLLEKNVHLLIEKPLTACPYKAKRLVDLAEEKNCVLSVGHCEQFNPAIGYAMESVGEARFIQSTRTSGYTFRSTDIGVVHDLMIHDIDLVNSAFGSELQDCQANGFAVFGGFEDMAQARLTYANGCVAMLTASRCSFQPERSMQIFGTDGFAAVNMADHTVRSIRYPHWLKRQGFDFQNADTEQQEFIRENLFTKILPVEEIKPPKANAILEEQKQWVVCIGSDRPLINSGQAAANAVRIASQILDQIDRQKLEIPTLLPLQQKTPVLPAELQPAVAEAA